MHNRGLLVSAHLGLLVCVSACKGLLFFACIQRETKKKEGEKRHTKNERERERERDDFLVLFCDHEDGDGWDDREE